MIVSIPIRDAMRTSVATAGPDATASTVARKLGDDDLGALVVLEDDEPVGIVTESDLLALLATGTDPSETPVETFMSAPLVSVGPDVDVMAAADRVREEGVSRLPVVEDGHLIGMLTAADLLDFVPDLVRDREGTLPRRPRTGLADVRTDTAYEREDWAFVYDASAPDSVDVGDVASFSKTLTDEDVRSFAETTGDTNRLHLDEEFAAGTRFGRRIVHGSLVTGIISAALARLPGLTIYLAQDFQFRAPVDVGDRVTAVCEVVESLGPDEYRLSVTVEDEDGAAVVTGSATVLIDPLPEVTA